MMNRKIAVLTEGHTNPMSAKTATGLIRYRPEEVVAVIDSTQVGNSCQELLGAGGDIPIVGSLKEAGAIDTLAIGIAPPGGKMPSEWRAIILEAIDNKISVVSGLHEFIGDDPELSAAAEKAGVTIHDVRKNNDKEVANRVGIRDECLRIHTVGHDCGVGKMVTAIEIQRLLVNQGCDAKFVATGQTGIMIEGDGCPIDCVVADFINGSAERLVLENQHHDIIFIEGQGSLFHPRYSAVTLGLLHGSIPHGLILCYEVGRTMVKGMDNIPLSPMAEVKRVFETMANTMFPCEVIGVAMNSRNVSDAEYEQEQRKIEAELGVPACDVIRQGPEPLAKAVLELKSRLENK